MRAVQHFVVGGKKKTFTTDAGTLDNVQLPWLLQNKVFIRSVDHTLYLVIHDGTSAIFTVEGIPGIGKTSMIPYFIWRLLCLGKETQTEKHFLLSSIDGRLFL